MCRCNQIKVQANICHKIMVKDVEYLMICFPSSLSMKNLEKDYEAVQLKMDIIRGSVYVGTKQDIMNKEL